MGDGKYVFFVVFLFFFFHSYVAGFGPTYSVDKGRVFWYLGPRVLTFDEG